MSAPAAGSPPAAPPPAPAGPAPARRVPRGLWRLGLGLLVSGAILVYLFTAQGADPRALVPLVRAISLPGLLAYVAISAVGLVLRALRYRLLLGRAVAFWPLVLITAVRNMAVDLVPARAAAAASYLYLVTSRLGLPLEAGVASFALSFILDTLALAPLLVLALLVVGNAPLPPAVLVGGSLVILLGSVAALWVLAPILRLAARVASRLPVAARRLDAAPARGGHRGRAARARADPPAGARACPSCCGSRSTARTTSFSWRSSRPGTEPGLQLDLPAGLPVDRGRRAGGLPPVADHHERRPVRSGRGRGIRLLARGARRSSRRSP